MARTAEERETAKIEKDAKAAAARQTRQGRKDAHVIAASVNKRVAAAEAQRFREKTHNKSSFVRASIWVGMNLLRLVVVAVAAAIAALVFVAFRHFGGEQTNQLPVGVGVFVLVFEMFLWWLGYKLDVVPF